MTKHRVDLGGAVVADSSGRPGDDDAVRGSPPRPEAIEADPGGRGLGRSAEGPESGTEDAAVGDPNRRGSPLDRADAGRTKGAPRDE